MGSVSFRGSLRKGIDVELAGLNRRASISSWRMVGMRKDSPALAGILSVVGNLLDVAALSS